MTESIIRDEWVEKAARASWEFEWPDRPWDTAHLYTQDFYVDSTRAALAAVADDIRADALQAAATSCRDALADAWDEGHKASERDWNFAYDLSTPDADRQPWVNPYREGDHE